MRDLVSTSAPSSLTVRLLRKCLTKPIWTWERNRPYPIRRKIFGLPARPVAGTAAVKLAVLTVPDGIADAAWTARSLLQEIPVDLGLIVVVDGELPERDHRAWMASFPGSTILRT